MAAQDPIWSCARDDLVIVDDQGHADILWEHAVRVVHLGEWLISQPDVPRDRVDRAVLTAAALYHDAGWMVQFREGNISRTDILGRSTSDLQRELGATRMEERLLKLLPPGVLKRAADCIRSFHWRDERFVEAQILFDADNLDQIGPLLWSQIMRQGLEGKGVQAAIDTWHRRKEYSFWDARIDALRFESARKAARRRLKEMDRSMAELARQHRGEDLPQIASRVESAEA